MAKEVLPPPEDRAEYKLTRAAFEYQSALSRCNSDIVISSYAKEFSGSSMINDNFCDCKQGSDEFTTAACSYLLVGHKVFHCGSARGPVHKISLRGRDRGHTKTIFPSRVNDSICDCEDCSDEDNFGMRINFHRI